MGAEVVVARPLGAKLHLRVEAIRNSPANARFVEDRLRTIAGVVEVTANPGAASVDIRYDPRAAGGIVDTARALTVMPKRELVIAVRKTASSSIFMRVAKFVTVVAIEVALQRLLGPLFLVRRC